MLERIGAPEQSCPGVTGDQGLGLVTGMTIRKSLKVSKRAAAVATLAAALAPAPALSEWDGTTAQVFARITQPVGLNETTEMYFGWMASPASPGTAQITPATQMLSSGLVIDKLDGASPATIVISGTPNQAVGLVVGEMANFDSGGRKVAVSSFTHNGGEMPALGPDGRATIQLGATLHLAANTKNGRYRGMFDVIVSNN